MLIYSKASKGSIDRAIAKAKAIKPTVKILGFGEFEVKGSSDKYTVSFGWNTDKEFIINCNCPAGQKNLVCYHSASCSSIFKLQVRERAAEKQSFIL